MFSSASLPEVIDFFFLMKPKWYNGRSISLWRVLSSFKTTWMLTLLVLVVMMLETEDWGVPWDCLCSVSFLHGFLMWRCSFHSSQVRNYTECACVQSRQVITPPTVGQRSQLRLVIVKTYLNENGYAVSGKCDRTCNTLIPFLIFLFIVTLITACAQPSAIIVTLRWELSYVFFAVPAIISACVRRGWGNAAKLLQAYVSLRSE